MTKILAELYPNGELRVRTRHIEPRRKDPVEPMPIPSKCSEEGNSGCGPLDYRCEFQEPFLGYLQRLVNRSGRYKSGWGLVPRKTKFGLRGKRKILRVGGVLDAQDGVKAAITLTLPAEGEKAYLAIAAWSGFLANRVKTWLYDQLENPHDVSYFYVWELQKRGALHLHLCINCGCRSVYRRIKRGIRGLWIRSLQTVMEKSGVHMFRNSAGYDWRRKKRFIQVDCQEVKVGVSRYFAKYCSKGSNGQESMIDKGFRPSRWWGCSRYLGAEMRRKTLKFCSPDLSDSQVYDVFEMLVEASDDVGSTYFKENPYNGKPYMISFCGESLGRGIMDELAYRMESFKSCLIEAMQQSDNRTQRRVRRIQRRWRDADERYKLAEIIGTDTPQWELICYLMIDEACIPAAQVSQILDFIDEAQAEYEQRKQDESGFYIPTQLNIAGL